MHGFISIENISFPKNCDIKNQNAKSVMDAVISVKFTLKKSNTLEIQHSVLTSHVAIFWYEWGSHISCELISLINPNHRILAQFVNKTQKSEIIIDSVVN